MLYDVVQVSPVRDGKQVITLPSAKTRTYVQCEASKEDVDKFLSERKKIEDKTAKKAVSTIGLGAIAGALTGFVVKSAESVVSRSGMGAVIGMTAGALLAMGVCLRGDMKKAKHSEKFIAENSGTEVEKSEE